MCLADKTGERVPCLGSCPNGCADPAAEPGREPGYGREWFWLLGERLIDGERMGCCGGNMLRWRGASLRMLLSVGLWLSASSWMGAGGQGGSLRRPLRLLERRTAGVGEGTSQSRIGSYTIAAVTGASREGK